MGRFGHNRFQPQIRLRSFGPATDAAAPWLRQGLLSSTAEPRWPDLNHWWRSRHRAYRSPLDQSVLPATFRRGAAIGGGDGGPTLGTGSCPLLYRVRRRNWFAD